MCKNLSRSDGQQWYHSKTKFPSNLNCGHKTVSETGPSLVTYKYVTKPQRVHESHVTPCFFRNISWIFLSQKDEYQWMVYEIMAIRNVLEWTWEKILYIKFAMPGALLLMKAHLFLCESPPTIDNPIRLSICNSWYTNALTHPTHSPITTVTSHEHHGILIHQPLLFVQHFFKANNKVNCKAVH